VPTIGDFTSSSDVLGASWRAGSVSAGAAIPSAGVARAPVTAGRSAGTETGAATWTAPRCCGLLEMRIFMPLSDEISMESTVDSSKISISFLT
jgi:hypothetical protein